MFKLLYLFGVMMLLVLIVDLVSNQLQFVLYLLLLVVSVLVQLLVVIILHFVIGEHTVWIFGLFLTFVRFVLFVYIGSTM